MLATITSITVLYAWRDFYAPWIYPQSQEHWTLALGLKSFHAVYTHLVNLLVAAPTLLIIPPILMFFLA